jgi:Tfp pilus assembly protein PilF
LRKAVEFEPRNVEYTLDLARAYEELGMPSNAIRAFERVLHLDSKKSEAAKALKRLK